jgi:putative transposase
MARHLPIEIPGGWYHIVIRGAESRSIFPDDASCDHFLERLSRLPERFGVRLHGYVLMGNHYHLQIETPGANLSEPMRWLNASYNKWYNRRYAPERPLFERGIKPTLHDQKTGALTINRYIHLNPVRAGNVDGHAAEGDPKTASVQPTRELVKARINALSYPWSSYDVYAGKRRNPGWITLDSIYRLFGKHTLHSWRGAYRRQVEEMAAFGQWETGWKASVISPGVFGSDSFVRKMMKLLESKRSEDNNVQKPDGTRVDWPSICAAVCAVWACDSGNLPSTPGNDALSAAWYLARTHSSAIPDGSDPETAGVRDHTTSAAVSRFEKRLKIDHELQAKIKAARGLLKT